MTTSDWNFCPRCATPLEPREVYDSVRPACPACDFVTFADPKVTVGVLIEREGRVLLGKRAVDPRMGLWCVPGGYVDYGERVREAAAREALEETGLVVEVGELLGVWDFGDDGVSDKKGVALFFRAEAEGEPVASDDLAEVGWFAPHEFPPIAFPSNEAVLREWVAAQA